MSTLRKALRTYVAQQVAKPGEHKKAELAASFLDEHDELAREYMRELAERAVADLIKDLCDESDIDPLPIFSGFPAAIAVAPGIVKATSNCLLDDLGVGMNNREENVQNAERKRRAFAESMARYEALRKDELETVGECTERLRLHGPIGGES
jgi:hypothetical protein